MFVVLFISHDLEAESKEKGVAVNCPGEAMRGLGKTSVQVTSNCTPVERCVMTQTGEDVVVCTIDVVPTLRYAGKVAVSAFPKDKLELFVDMKASRRAVDGRIVVGRIFSPSTADPHTIIDDLRRPWPPPTSDKINIGLCAYGQREKADKDKSRN